MKKRIIKRFSFTLQLCRPPPPPHVLQTGNGNDRFLSEAALKALLERQSRGGAAFLRSRQPLCDVRFKASPLPFHL